MAKGKKGAERIPHAHVDRFSKEPEEKQRIDAENRELWIKKRGPVKVPTKNRHKSTKRSTTDR